MADGYSEPVRRSHNGMNDMDISNTIKIKEGAEQK